MLSGVFCSILQHKLFPMKPNQDLITSKSSFSTQNCKLRLNPVLLSIDHAALQVTHDSSMLLADNNNSLQQHLFNQIPRIQNSLHRMGIRIRGLSILQTSGQHHYSV